MNRRALKTLPMLVLFLGLTGFTAGSCGPGDEPTPCTDPGCNPRPACDSLSEAACTARSDCEARYQVLETRCESQGVDVDDAAPRCGTTTRTFVGCVDAPKLCPAISCSLDCAYGLARDANGCDVCACSPIPCASDAECPAGQACLFPAVQCAGLQCAPVQGVCGVIGQPGCGSDAECRAGERCVFPTLPECPPNALCAPPRGTCKPADGCVVDADCGVGRYCELVAVPVADAAAPCAKDQGCFPPLEAGVCRDRVGCTTTAQCAPGEVCAADPNDPCTKAPCAMLRAPPTYCQPACPALGEAACLARSDCEAMWGSAAKAPDTGMRADFLGCKPVGCPPVMCDLYCPTGFQVDATGCQICSCQPAGCRSDAECLPGQSCVFPVYDCAGADCGKPYVEGRCEWVQQGCLADSDCAAGERCQRLVTCAVNAAGEEYCVGTDPGVCVPATCQADADCRSGERCEFAMVKCGAGEADRCAVPAEGRCVPARCLSDADCRAGESCIAPASGAICDSLDPACNPYGTCVALPVGCVSDAECKAGEFCALSDCAPGSDCSPRGQCLPRVAGCQADSDCRANEICLLVDCASGSDCGVGGQCVARPACKSDAECPAGQSCQPDPTDPCNGGVPCFAPGAMICLPVK